MSKENRQAFIAALHAKGIGHTPLEAEMIWKSCCDLALDWMVNKEQPVDMWFIRLHITPLRRDWKTALARYFLGFIVSLGVYADKEPTPRYRSIYFKKLMTEPRMMAMDGDIVQKFVEVEHLPMWRRLIRRVEKKRLEMLNANGYAASVVNTIERGYDWNVRRFREWLARCAQPSAEIVYDRCTQLPRLVESRAPFPINIQGKRLTPFLGLVFTKNGKSAQGTCRPPKRLRRENVSVPGMRTVRSGESDVRDNRGDVPKSTDEKA